MVLDRFPHCAVDFVDQPLVRGVRSLLSAGRSIFLSAGRGVLFLSAGIALLIQGTGSKHRIKIPAGSDLSVFPDQVMSCRQPEDTLEEGLREHRILE